MSHYEMTDTQLETAEDMGSQLMAAIAEAIGDRIEDTEGAHMMMRNYGDAVEEMTWRFVDELQEVLMDEAVRASR